MRYVFPIRERHWLREISSEDLYKIAQILCSRPIDIAEPRYQPRQRVTYGSLPGLGQVTFCDFSHRGNHSTLTSRAQYITVALQPQIFPLSQSERSISRSSAPSSTPADPRNF